MKDKKPDFLFAKLGEYKAPSENHVRITAEGCVMNSDMLRLRTAEPVQRDVWVQWDGQVKKKTFTRLKMGRYLFLADWVTGTLYSEGTGLTTSPGLKLAWAR